ncbi:hypothetical protein ACPCBC_29410 [Streptomyces incarnatus]
MANPVDRPDAASSWTTPDVEDAGVVLTPLMNQRYLRDLARYRWLLASATRVPYDRAQALLDWWNTLTAVMTAHHQALEATFRALPAATDPEAESALSALATRHALLAASRADAGMFLTHVLDTGRPSSSAQLPFIRFHEEATATAFWEEREFLPLAARSLTPADRLRVGASVLAVQAAGDTLAFVLPWLCETLPPSRRQVILSAFPAGMTHVYHEQWLPAHARLAARAWSGPPAQPHGPA